MSEAIIVRCGSCQQRMKVVPQAAPIQVKCPKCATLLRIAGTATTPRPKVPGPKVSGPQASAPAAPSQPRPAQASPTMASPTMANPGQAKSATPPRRSVASPFDLGTTSSLQPAPVTPHSALQRPTSPGTFKPGMGNGPQQPVKAKSKFPRWILYTLGGFGLMFLLCCGGVGLLVSTFNKSAAPVVPIDIALRASPPPRELFPPLGNPEQQFPSGVKSYFISMNEATIVPGRNMQMRVFVPPGDHPDQSLPCVLIAPAGTPMINGAAIEPNDGYNDETLPYAEAGFVVIQYSIDGHVDTERGEPGISDRVKAYEKFKVSGAGVVNGRNACEYALTKLKFVDPKRIHCAGHSSAGALALLLAAHEPRINRCVAFAAAYDVESLKEDMTSNFAARSLFPGISEFMKFTSPMNHVTKFRNPIFVFHARDDSNIPFADAERFVKQLQRAGKSVTFEQVPTGDHYEPMLDPGIPKAIQWLQQT